MDTDQASLLRARGIQVTAQRLAVLRAVAGEPHITADRVAEVVRTEIGAISLQSVYDALNVLVAEGLIRRIQPAGSPARFEDRVGDNHHHLICRICGRVVDVDCAVGAAPCLTASRRPGLPDRRGRDRLLGALSGLPVAQAGRASIRNARPPPRRDRRRGNPRQHEQRSEVPVLQQARTGTANQDWWPSQLNLSALHTNHPAGDPMDEGFDYAEGVPVARSRRREEGHRGGDDRLAGLVAGRLRPLWAASSSAWRGTARAPTASTTAAAAPAPARSASRRSAAGRTTPTSTRRAGCCGRSSRSTAARSRGPT